MSELSDRETVRQAVREIRREGYKAALLHATVEATVAVLIVNLIVGRLVPVTLPGPLSSDGQLAVAITVGLSVFAIAGGLRVRRYTVERFEATNPVVADALRTARDSTRDGTDSPMARRLYADVADRLQEASASGFVDTRLLGSGIVAVLVLSGATLGAAVTGFEATPSTPEPTTDGSVSGGDGSPDTDYDGLQNGTEVLGDPKEVDRGTEDLLANATAVAGGGTGDERSQYEDTGYESTDPTVSASQAGFDDDEQVENVDLLREYTLRLNQRDTDD